MGHPVFSDQGRMPVGAALLLLQGIALLLKDIAVVIDPSIAEIDASIRPEG